MEVIKVEENKGKDDEYKSKFVSLFTPNNKHCAFTALGDFLFVPRGYYVKVKDGIPVILDSGCSHALTPLESDFIGSITPIDKIMNGLGATVKIAGIGVVGWTFRDDYGVMRKG